MNPLKFVVASVLSVSADYDPGWIKKEELRPSAICPSGTMATPFPASRMIKDQDWCKQNNTTQTSWGGKKTVLTRVNGALHKVDADPNNSVINRWGQND